MTGELLRQLFRRLVEAQGLDQQAVFSALTVPGSGGHMVALSAEGRPCLLIRTTEAGDTPSRIHLSGLRASFGVLCRFSVDGAVPDERYVSIIECTAAEDVRPIFADLSLTFLRLLGERPTMNQTAFAVARFAAIFAALNRPSRQSVTGLIGELMIISLAANPAAAVGCWRSTDFDHFDFVAPDGRVECKATSLGSRIHSMSWEQCNPPDGPALVASLYVERTGGGTSVQDFIHRIESMMTSSPDAAIRMRETISATMGAGLQQALQVRFDEAACRASLLWFDLRAVPAVRGELQAGVSGLRFMSNMTMADPIQPSRLVGTGLASLIPI